MWGKRGGRWEIGVSWRHNSHLTGVKNISTVPNGESSNIFQILFNHQCRGFNPLIQCYLCSKYGHSRTIAPGSWGSDSSLVWNWYPGWGGKNIHQINDLDGKFQNYIFFRPPEPLPMAVKLTTVRPMLTLPRELGWISWTLSWPPSRKEGRSTERKTRTLIKYLPINSNKNKYVQSHLNWVTFSWNVADYTEPESWYNATEDDIDLEPNYQYLI